MNTQLHVFQICSIADELNFHEKDKTRPSALFDRRYGKFWKWQASNNRRYLRILIRLYICYIR